MEDRKKEGINPTFFISNSDSYSEVWKFLEDNSATFVNSDILVVHNWYKVPIDNGPRQAFKDWDKKQSRFYLEEISGFFPNDYNVKTFLVVKKSMHLSHDSDYFEWSD